MPRILRTPASRSDYDEIWSYVAVRDLAAADRLIDKFDATLVFVCPTTVTFEVMATDAPRELTSSPS